MLMDPSEELGASILPKDILRYCLSCGTYPSGEYCKCYL